MKVRNIHTARIATVVKIEPVALDRETSCTVYILDDGKGQARWSEAQLWQHWQEVKDATTEARPC